MHLSGDHGDRPGQSCNRDRTSSITHRLAASVPQLDLTQRRGEERAEATRLSGSRDRSVRGTEMMTAVNGGSHQPVLLLNPKSGGGKAQRYNLVARCRASGIEPVVMKAGDDLASLAVNAVSSGADVIGMAGGDGSQAIVAAVAAQHDIPYVCIPAGTRNHFALDIGVDREDVIGALDAFHLGSERRIDLAQVNGRVFVNNASMGLYGTIVKSPSYRDAKLRTILEKLPELAGPGAHPFDLRFTDPEGVALVRSDVLLVSNNRYEVNSKTAPRTRGDMNKGVLGVVVVPHGPPFLGWREWTAPVFEVDSNDAIDIGLDGEAVSLNPPLTFESLPSALRIRCQVMPRSSGRGGSARSTTRFSPSRGPSR